MPSFHRDLQEMAVIESHRLRHCFYLLLFAIGTPERKNATMGGQASWYPAFCYPSTAALVRNFGVLLGTVFAGGNKQVQHLRVFQSRCPMRNLALDNDTVASTQFDRLAAGVELDAPAQR